MYLMGVSDATVAWGGFGDLSKQICLTVGITGEQLRKVFVKYANENPEYLHLGASGMVLNAFARAFPCE